jgi:hypothetical protein
MTEGRGVWPRRIATEARASWDWLAEGVRVLDSSTDPAGLAGLCHPGARTWVNACHAQAQGRTFLDRLAGTSLLRWAR